MAEINLLIVLSPLNLLKREKKKKKKKKMLHQTYEEYRENVPLERVLMPAPLDDISRSGSKGAGWVGSWGSVLTQNFIFMRSFG